MDGFLHASVLLDDIGMIQSRVNFVRDRRKAVRSQQGQNSVGYGFKAFKSVCV